VSFLKQTVITFLAKGGLLLASLAFNILLAHKLGAGGVGVVGTLQAFSVIAVQMGYLGLDRGGIYYIGLDRNRASAIAGTMVVTGAAMSIVLFGGFIAAALLFPSILGKIDFGLYLIMLVSIAPLLISLFSQSLLLAYQRIVAYNMIELAIRVAVLIAAIVAFATLNKTNWVLAAVWLTVGSAFAMAIVNGGFAWLSSPFRLRIDWKALRDMFGYSWKNYVSALMVFLVVRTDILFLNFCRTQAEAGIYKQVVWINDILLMIPITLAMLLFPKLMQEGASEETGLDERGRFTMLLARLVGFVLRIFWVLGAIFGIWFLGIFGDEFVGGYGPLLILLAGTVFLGVQAMLRVELFRRGLPVFVVVYSTVGLIVKVIGNVILVPKYGMYGAAWSSLATHFLFMVLPLWYCVKYYGYSVSGTLFMRDRDLKIFWNRLMQAIGIPNSSNPGP